MSKQSASLFPDFIILESDEQEAVDNEPECPGPWLAEVALKVPLDQTFHYRVPGSLREHMQVGVRCEVPFGHRKLLGYVVGLPESTDMPAKKLKSIYRLLDKEPVFNSEMLELCCWLSNYYSSALAEVLEVALPKSVIREWQKSKQLRLETVLRARPGEKEGRMGASTRAMIELLEAEVLGLSLEEIMDRTGVSRATLRRCLKKNWIEVVKPKAPEGTFHEADKPTLNDEQNHAVEAICSDLNDKKFQVSLVLGITGSGKTEVYLRSIEHCLKLGRGAIVLVPEIALTPQTTRRFRARFGGHVAVLHSRLSDYERWQAWHRVKKGEARVVIGPRSALFAPVKDLGLIVVDEEHESTYKQERSPRYQARDVAVVRASRLGAAVVLGSATPSLESYQNALSGRYRLIKLCKRATGGSLPPVNIVDMGMEWREVKGAPLISRSLMNVVNDSLERGERAILFLNRRGFNTFLHCIRCGFVLKCPHCDIALTFHKRKGIVLCHFCGEHFDSPSGPCPECHGPSLKHRGAGTERIEEICKLVFPMAKIERVDSDTVRSGDSIEARLDRFRRGETNLLIGTQMIARGLDIKEVTAVGIINADTALGHPDFRATERTFQLIAQVAGRAGRGDLPGRTVVQTFNPNEPSILAAAQHDFQNFADSEIHARKILGYPPFGRLLHVLIRGKIQETAEQVAQDVVEFIKEELPEDCRILGPAVSPRAYLANKFRFQALIKGPHSRAIQAVIHRAQEFKVPNGIEVVLDRDPLFLL